MSGRAGPLALTGETLRDEDWGGRVLAGDRFVGCTFSACDLSEIVTSGVTFEECRLVDVRLNASQHQGSAFVGCDLTGVSLFDAELDGCKLVGTRFLRCTLRPLTARGGNWSFVTLRGTDLGGIELRDLSLVEADLTDCDLTGATVAGCDLSRAELRGARLHDADLRGSVLLGVDPQGPRWRDARLDLAQAVTLAEALGAVVDP